MLVHVETWGMQRFRSMPRPRYPETDHGSGKVLQVKRKIFAAHTRSRNLVDGGITDTTVGACFAAGADAFVAGSYVFGNPDYAVPIAALRRECADSGEKP